jgi:peptidoglycan biosynthesis protein MviN/MurJ (putative lipid II flippase)
VNRVLVSCFHARKDLRTPVVVGMANMAVNVLLAWALSSGPLGHAGIACAATLAACVQTVCLLAAHLRVAELREGRGLAFQGLSAALVRTALATAVMGAACYAADLWVPQASGKALGTLRVLGLVGGGAGVFFLSARVAGMPELGMLLQGIAQKSRK